MNEENEGKFKVLPFKRRSQPLSEKHGAKLSIGLCATALFALFPSLTSVPFRIFGGSSRLEVLVFRHDSHLKMEKGDLHSLAIHVDRENRLLIQAPHSRSEFARSGRVSGNQTPDETGKKE